MPPKTNGFRILHGCRVLVSKLWCLIPRSQRRNCTRRLCHRLAILGLIRSRELSFTARDGSLLLGSKGVGGIMKEETRHYIVMQLIDHVYASLCCLYSFFVIRPEVPFFVWFFVFIHSLYVYVWARSYTEVRFYFYYVSTSHTIAVIGLSYCPMVVLVRFFFFGWKIWGPLCGAKMEVTPVLHWPFPQDMVSHPFSSACDWWHIATSNGAIF